MGGGQKGCEQLNFLHFEEWMEPGDTAVVSLGSQARVMLLDEQSFTAYRQGRAGRFHGGWATRSPVHLSPPCQGNWHVVVDLAGRSGRVSADVQLARGA